MNVARAGALAAVALAAGCTAFTPARTDITSYVLVKVPAEVRATVERPVGIAVPTPESAPLYTTRRMAYATQRYQIGYFNESEWVLPPARMIQPLLAEALRRTGRFAVEAPSAPGTDTFVLRSELLEFTQDFTSQPAVFRLRMRLSLERGARRQVVAARELSASEPLDKETARAGVAAANDAVERVLRDATAFAVENTARATP